MEYKARSILATLYSMRDIKLQRAAKLYLCFAPMICSRARKNLWRLRGAESYFTLDGDLIHKPKFESLLYFMTVEV